MHDLFIAIVHFLYYNIIRTENRTQEVVNMMNAYPYTTYQQSMQNMFSQNNNYPYQQMMNNNAMRQEIIKVNGRGGAEAYQMPANSSVLLLDESAPLVWLKTTDGAGYPNLTPYSITPYSPEPSVDLHSLENRIAKLEDIINAKSDTSKSSTQQPVKQHNEYNRNAQNQKP